MDKQKQILKELEKKLNGTSFEDIGEAIMEIQEEQDTTTRPFEKWEYKKETSEFHLTDEEFIRWLNEEGQNGWEMIEYRVGYEDDWGREKYTCIFKRKIQ